MMGDEDFLTVQHTMDIWSLGLTIIELCLVEVFINEKYKQILGAKKLDSGNAIIEWLIWKCPAKGLKMPDKVLNYDNDFAELVSSLLKTNPKERSSLPKAIDSPF